MAVIVIDERCIMAGECIYNHPEYFGWRHDQAGAEVRRSRIDTAEDRRHADQAVGMCPAGAISIRATS